MQMGYHILSPIGYRMEPNLYKWLPYVCPLGFARPDVEFNNTKHVELPPYDYYLSCFLLLTL